MWSGRETGLVSHLRRLQIRKSRTQRFRAGLNYAAPTALGQSWELNSVIIETGSGTDTPAHPVSDGRLRPGSSTYYQEGVRRILADVIPCAQRRLKRRARKRVFVLILPLKQIQ